MRLLAIAGILAAQLHGAFVVEAAAQGATIRLEGDGRLGPAADEHRGTSAAYGYEGTPPSVIPAMIQLAGITSSDVVYEPGCGDARLVIAAVRAGARKGLGVDIDPDLAEVAYAEVKAAGMADKIEVRWGNALDIDMSETTVVFLFMGEPFNLIMRPLLWQQLPVGARVVSNDFAMGDWKPDRTLRVDTPARTYVLYLWTITQEIKSQAAAALPADVDPDSRSRLPLVKREALNEEGKKAYDAAAASSPTGRPQGVAAIRLHRSGVDVRWDSPVGRRLTELAIITAAREHDQPYEWSLHELEALSVGLEPEIIDIVRHRRPLTGVGDREAAIIQFGRELGTHKVTAGTYARALQLFGTTNLVDLVDLMAQYAGTAVNLTAANQWMPPQMKQFLPLPFTPPDDILPDSRSRIPAANPNPPAPSPQANRAPAGLYRRTLAPPPTGPGSMGRFARGLESLESSQGRALIALAILVTAREHDEQYDWTINEIAARKDGLDPAVIDIVRHRRPLTGLGEKEATLIQFGRELFGKHYVTAETYARANQIFGQTDLADFVVGVMAPHAREAALLTAFDQHLPPGQPPLLPVP
jgi:hypothetical protein